MGRIAEALARAERERVADTRGVGEHGFGAPTQLESERTSPDTGTMRTTAHDAGGRSFDHAYPMTSAINRWSNWYGSTGDSAPPTSDGDGDEDIQTKQVPQMAPEVITFYDRASLPSEQYRSLRTRLLSQNPYQERRIWAITSAIPKEGKSLTTVNFAFSLAEIRHLRVLVVDCDLRHSSLAKIMGIPNEPGLADMLQNRASYEEIIRPTPIPNLFFIPAGRTHGRSAPELLSTPTARATFARFQKEFHYTLVDTPPAATVADVGIIGQMTSGVLFVVRMHRTPEPLARRAVKHLLNNNVGIIGAIVVGDDDPTGGYGRPYSYYRYYREGGDKE